MWIEDSKKIVRVFSKFMIIYENGNMASLKVRVNIVNKKLYLNVFEVSVKNNLIYSLDQHTTSKIFSVGIEGITRFFFFWLGFLTTASWDKLKATGSTLFKIEFRNKSE